MENMFYQVILDDCVGLLQELKDSGVEEGQDFLEVVRNLSQF